MKLSYVNINPKHCFLTTTLLFSKIYIHNNAIKMTKQTYGEAYQKHKCALGTCFQTCFSKHVNAKNVRMFCVCVIHLTLSATVGFEGFVDLAPGSSGLRLV